MTTPNNGIPWVPENTLDPAAGLNLALKVIDALLQAVVQGFDSVPPLSPNDGDAYIVVSGSGDWAGQDNQLAVWDAQGEYWHFYSAKLVLNANDGAVYYKSASGWTPAASRTPIFSTYAQAELPAASVQPGLGVLVSDAPGGLRPFWSDGVAWVDAAGIVL